MSGSAKELRAWRPLHWWQPPLPPPVAAPKRDPTRGRSLSMAARHRLVGALVEICPVFAGAIRLNNVVGCGVARRSECRTAL